MAVIRAVVPVLSTISRQSPLVPALWHAAAAAAAADDDDDDESGSSFPEDTAAFDFMCDIIFLNFLYRSIIRIWKLVKYDSVVVMFLDDQGTCSGPVFFSLVFLVFYYDVL